MKSPLSIIWVEALIIGMCTASSLPWTDVTFSSFWRTVEKCLWKKLPCYSWRGRKGDRRKILCKGLYENPLHTSRNEAGTHDCKHAGQFALLLLPLYLSQWLGWNSRASCIPDIHSITDPQPETSNGVWISMLANTPLNQWHFNNRRFQ